MRLRNAIARVLLIVGFVWASVGAQARAQDVTEVSGANDGKSGIVSSDSLIVTDTSLVNPATIVLQLDQTAARIQDVGRRIAQVESTDAVGRRLDAHAAEVDSLFQTYSTLPTFKLSFRDLNNIERVWARLHLQGREWDMILVSRLEELERVQIWLDEERLAWQSIEEQATDLDYALFEERISRLFSQMHDLDQDVNARLATIVGFSDRLDNQLILTDQIGQGLEVRLESARVRLFERDGPWLGSALLKEKSFRLRGDVLRASDRDMQAFKAYFLSFPDRFAKHGIALLFFLIVGFAVRSRSRVWDQERPALKGLVHVLERPISVAVLLSLLTASILYEDAPMVLSDIIQLISLVPMIRILPGMMPASLRAPFFVFLGLLSLHFANELFRAGSPIERLVVLTSSLGSALLLGRYLYLRVGFRRLSRGRWWRIAVFLLHIAFTALVVGVVANLIGYATLAEMLTLNILMSIYTGIAVYAMIQILEGSWSLLLSSVFARQLHAIRLHAAVFHRRGVFLIRLGLVLWWFDRLFLRFGVSNFVADWIGQIIATEFSIGALSVDLGNILMFIFTMWMAVLVSRLVRFMLQNDVYPRLSLQRGMSSAMSSLTNYGILAIGFLTAFSAAGMDFQNITLLAGAFGIGIGFGLQTIVNNFLSGLILIFERPIQVGDTIEFQAAAGPMLAQVKRIGIRASIVRSFDGAEVIMPNANLVSNDVTNWTKSDQLRRIEVKVGVAYGSDPDFVLQLLKDIAENHPGVLKRPEPVALFMGFGDSALEFALRGWTPDFDSFLTLRSELTTEVYRALKAADIKIPFPQRDIHVIRNEGEQSGESELRI